MVASIYMVVNLSWKKSPAIKSVMQKIVRLLVSRSRSAKGIARNMAPMAEIQPDPDCNYST